MAAVALELVPVDPQALIDAGVWVVCGSCDKGVPAEDVETCPWHGHVCEDCRANTSLCKRSCRD